MTLAATPRYEDMLNAWRILDEREVTWAVFVVNKEREREKCSQFSLLVNISRDSFADSCQKPWMKRDLFCRNRTAKQKHDVENRAREVERFLESRIPSHDGDNAHVHMYGQRRRLRLPKSHTTNYRIRIHYPLLPVAKRILGQANPTSVQFSLRDTSFGLRGKHYIAYPNGQIHALCSSFLSLSCLSTTTGLIDLKGFLHDANIVLSHLRTIYLLSFHSPVLMLMWSSRNTGV